MGHVVAGFSRKYAAGGGFPTFPTIASIWAWGEPFREAYANGANMTQLADQSGNGRHWVNTQGADYPTMLTADLNSLAVAQFVGKTPGSPTANRGQHWEWPNLSGLTAVHLYAVLRGTADPSTTAGGEGGWHDTCGSGQISHIPYTDSNIYEGFGSTTRRTVGDPASSLAAWYGYEIISTGSEYTVLRSGSSLFTSGTNTVGWNSMPRRLGTGNNGSAWWSWSGKIAGVYIFSAKITGTDRSNLISYINSTFGLSVT